MPRAFCQRLRRLYADPSALKRHIQFTAVAMSPLTDRRPQRLYVQSSLLDLGDEILTEALGPSVNRCLVFLRPIADNYLKLGSSGVYLVLRLFFVGRYYGRNLFQAGLHGGPQPSACQPSFLHLVHFRSTAT